MSSFVEKQITLILDNLVADSINRTLYWRKFTKYDWHQLRRKAVQAILTVVDESEKVTLKVLYNNPPYDWPKTWPFPLPSTEIATRNSVGGWTRKLKSLSKWKDNF